MKAEDTQPLKDDLEPALSRAGGRCQRYSTSLSPSRGSDTVSVLVQMENTKKKIFLFSLPLQHWPSYFKCLCMVSLFFLDMSHFPWSVKAGELPYCNVKVNIYTACALKHCCLPDAWEVAQTLIHLWLVQPAVMKISQHHIRIREWQYAS